MGRASELDQRRRATAGADASDRVLHTDGLLSVVFDGTPGRAVVRLAGELDTTNRGAVERALREAHRLDAALALDLERLSFVDVAGARALLGFVHETSAPVRHVPGRLRRLLEVLGLTF
ncbi:STAS domain-containing protein [Nonomuraea muscovyensis]